MVLYRFLMAALLLCSITLHAQKADTSFQKEWIQIDTLLVQRNLTKTSLQKVNALYLRAKQRQLPAQQLKALIYRYTLESRIQESDPNYLWRTLQTEIAATRDGVQKSLLHALLAKNLQQYFERSRWQLYGRTKTISFLKSDPATWGADDYLDAITEQYRKSLQAKDALRKIPLTAYEAILLKGEGKTAPGTLYELLSREALNYFKSADFASTKPTNLFVLNDPRALGTLDIFLQTRFRTSDSSSRTWATLEMFQELLRMYRNDADKNNLVHYNLERLEWVYAQAAFASKDTAYRRALEEITRNYPKVPASAQAWYLVARTQANLAARYSPFEDTSHRYGYVSTESMIQTAMVLYTDTTEGVVNLLNLLTEIRRKELRTEIEKVNLPGKPFRTLVHYRNIPTLYGRVIRMNENSTNDWVHKNQWETGYWNKLSKLPVVNSFNHLLPAGGDHQPHAAEIPMTSLPPGEYALLSSDGANFQEGTDRMGIHFFHVSAISYLQNRNAVFVLHRETGMPLANVKITVMEKKYLVSTRKNVEEVVGTQYTDQNGYVNLTERKQNGNYHYIFTHGADQLNLRQQDPIYYDNRDEEDRPETVINYEHNSSRIFFFTDRSIYRPGQTVSFKGIGTRKDFQTRRNKRMTSQDDLWVYLNDVNRKKIDSLHLVPNEYGSFSGKFLLPQEGLTGNFSLSVDRFANASTHFSVEAYKRPSFLVSFDKPKGAYRLNDSIQLTGTVHAYSGNGISDANVVYSIIRVMDFRTSAYTRDNFIGRPYFSHPPRIIAQGTVTTDATGVFNIQFQASADDIIDSSSNPLFEFVVTADVTDNNGETRSGRTQLNAGFSSLLLITTIAPTQDVDSFKNIRINTTNYSDEKIPGQVSVKVFALPSPDRLVRARYWQRPDQFLLPENEFIRSFPYDEYHQESNPMTWKKSQLVAQGTIHTEKETFFNLPIQKLPAGFYKIETESIDVYGKKVKDVVFTQLFDRSAGQLPSLNPQFHHVVKRVAEPGDTSVFLTGSAAPGVFILRNTEKPEQKKPSFEFIHRKAGLHTISYTPTETDRGGVLISEAYVFQNRVYTQQYQVMVPWTNKQLTVDYASYRNKTEPGREENWTVTVKHANQVMAGAELLTTLYDASLDQFKPHQWFLPALWNTFSSRGYFMGSSNFTIGYGYQHEGNEPQFSFTPGYPPTLAIDALELARQHISGLVGNEKYNLKEKWLRLSMLYNNNEMLYESVVANQSRTAVTGAAQRYAYEKAPSDASSKAMTSGTTNNTEPLPSIPIEMPVSIRKNFNETAFFFPQLYADSSGSFRFGFTMPDAVTRWKWMSLAHTKDLAFGQALTEITTQKTLMVQANALRFMREGDQIEFSGKITNQSNTELTGQVTLELIDATTNTSVDGWFQNVFPVQYFTVAAGQSSAVQFPIQIPFSFNRPLTWRMVAKTVSGTNGSFSDGEENIVPIVTSRILVTESLPLFLRKDTTQSFRFEKLIETTSESLTQQGLTVEYSTNPIWYAVQALPYLMENRHEGADQLFNRLYGNTLASFLVNKHPQLKKTIEAWKRDTTALQSNLQKNEELKQILLQETPWVLDAENEAQQKRNIALLFDVKKLAEQNDQLITKLLQAQLPNGAFAWFKGGQEDRYMTLYILTGLGKLQRIGALSPSATLQLKPLLDHALKYADEKLKEDYQRLVRNKADLGKQQLYTTQIHHLYMRSFFKEYKFLDSEAHAYYYGQGKKFWVKENLFNQAMLGLAFHRNNEKRFVNVNILPSITENAIEDKTRGTLYWKSRQSFFWHASPIEHQSMMLQFLQEVQQEFNLVGLSEQINAARTWLIANKQTSHWRTNAATADACYALLTGNDGWLTTDRTLNIQLGTTTISNSNSTTEAGTGYLKDRIPGNKVTPDMGQILVTTRSSTSTTSNDTPPSWGAVYWQYFEDMDKVTAATSPLSLRKKLFIEKNTSTGKVLDPVLTGAELKPGDKIVIRIEINTDRDLDYVHLKDLRAASMEPLNVLSSYRWQDGFGYYESTKDIGTDFFIDHLRRGTYVFEYPVFITHKGIFSAGIATIQCLYAPEYTAHSEGIKLRVGQ